MNKFDDLIEAMRREQPQPAAVEEAAGRVRASLFRREEENVERIRGCAGFQALLPAYRRGALSEARRLLVQDHLKECVACRRALGQGAGPKLAAISPARPARLRYQWAIAAAVALCAGLSVLATMYWLPSAMGGARAVVASAEGLVYRVSGQGAEPLGVGRELFEGQFIRTGKGGRAVLKLADGSLVEMNERADLSVTRDWRGATIQLERGQIIVQAAKQRSGRLMVDAGDCQVSVKGTVFAVNRGTMGARVSVVEGEVRVDRLGRSESLHPGEQVSTHPAVTKVPIRSEVAWSRNSAGYLALVGEMRELERRVDALPGPGLRYKSRLLLLAPEDTTLFAAIPNLTTTLLQTRQLFEERLRESPVLREWWNSPSNARTRQAVDELIEWMKDLSRFLGDEVVVVVGGPEPQKPLVMAELRGDGAADFLERILARAEGKRPFEYSIRGGVLLIAADSGRLQQAEAALDRGGAAPSGLRERIAETYRSGAGFVLAADLSRLASHGPRPGRKPKEFSAADLGIDDIQNLVLEWKEVGGRAESRADLTFRGQRHGMAAWLASPGPMTSLEFVSPEASGAVSVVVKHPRALVEELFALARRDDSRFDAELARVEQILGLRVLDDLAGPLGTEATFALDGPLLPTPSWKAVVEVQQPGQLQYSIEKLVEAYNREANLKTGKAALAREQAGQRTFYRLSVEKLPWEVHYAYVDGYLVAGASRPLITQAIGGRQTGLTLPRSERFRNLLPLGSNLNASGLVYHNMGGMLGSLAGQIEGLVEGTPIEKQAAQALRETGPGLICLYAEPDRIQAASAGRLFGLNLSTLAGLQGMSSLLARPGAKRAK